MVAPCLFTFRFIGGVNFSPSYVGSHTVTLDLSQRFKVETGDVLGLVFYNGSTIPFDTVVCSGDNYYRLVFQMEC